MSRRLQVICWTPTTCPIAGRKQVVFQETDPHFHRLIFLALRLNCAKLKQWHSLITLHRSTRCFRALRLARGKALNLVEIAAKAAPPVCRIVNYGKFLYEESKRGKDAQSRQGASRMKEVQLSPAIDPHDLAVKWCPPRPGCEGRPRHPILLR